MQYGKLYTFFYHHYHEFNLLNGVFLAAGIATYFALPIEPAIWIPMICCILFGVLFYFSRHDMPSRLIIGYLFMFGLGLTVSTIRTAVVSAPVLKCPLYDTHITGTIDRLEPRSNGYRITLNNVMIDGLNVSETPDKIRLNYANKEPALKIGDTIEGYAHLIPPMPPMQEGAYDFSRAAFYMRLGAVGKLVDLTEHHAINDNKTFHHWFENIRLFISNRTQTILPPSSAAIVVPLIIGDQGLVTPSMYERYRTAGIIHVLSVSGFHLTLLAGVVFFLIRGLFSLIPHLESYINTKKLSAVLSLCILLFYLFISGLQIPAIRSFLMITIVLGAVLFNRSAISLRTAVFAGSFILIFWPESLLSSGFQLSFIAVFAMLSLYEVLMKFFKNSPYKHYLWYKCWLIFIGSVCVSLLATLSTAPYGIYHFNQFAPYSILGNLTTNILFSFIIMPLLLIGVLCMPFGGDKLFLIGSGKCLDIISDICMWIQSLPYADITVPSFDTWGLIIITMGLIILFFFQGRIRWIGIPIIFCSLFSFLTIEKPDILISEGGKLIAIRQPDGQLRLSDKSANTMAANTWLKRNGQNPNTDSLAPFAEKFIKINNKKIAFNSLSCADADYTFLTTYDIGDCPEPVVQKNQLWQGKTHAVFITQNDIVVKNIENYIKKRPWSHFFSCVRK